MKTIIRYNPSISTINIGDVIIFDSVQRELNNIFNNNFVIDVSTHLPVSYVYSRLLRKADYKFVCGTNLLMGKLNGLFRQWDINLLNAKLLGPAILVGTGWWQYDNKPNLYTKTIYGKILSREYMHSVRDEYTKKMLNSMGFDNVVCTSCPTMWNLTPEHCSDIPISKAGQVITTLTDYNKNEKYDNLMLDKLYQTYDKVYVWLQGIGDYEYLKRLHKSEKLSIIAPTLQAYDDILSQDNIEYVGTRLHGGIRAIQKKKRCIIVGVDNRAQEKKKDFNLNVITRENLHELDDLVKRNFSTNITIPLENIMKWKSQFDN